jgi:hypothetical protein
MSGQSSTDRDDSGLVSTDEAGAHGRCTIKVVVTLRAEWVASLVGYGSASTLADCLKESLLADTEEVISLPGVKVSSVQIVTDGVLRCSE